MTCFSPVSRRLLGALTLTLACVIPTAYALTAEAAELEGTVVAVEPGAPAAPEHPQPGISDVAPPPGVVAEHEQRVQENEQRIHENNQRVAERQQWEREFEAGMKDAFGHGRPLAEEFGDAFEAAVLIPIFAVIFIFGGPIFLLAFWIAKRYSARAARQQNLNQNIDKLLAAGRDIPVELLRGDDPIHEEDLGSRDKGIRNVCLGTGWLVFLSIMVGFDIGSAGFIWIALGASQVLIWYLNNPKNKPVDDQAAPQD